MESFGECKGCQRNIKFAVKQARLCRTCYNKTYLTSQKRREYYKNKKRKREMSNNASSTSVEPAINVHQHHHHRSSSSSSARASIKKTSTSSVRATEQHQQNQPQQLAHLQDNYRLPSSAQAHHHSGPPSCTDWVPRQATDGFSLLAALAHAASSPSSSPAVRPYFSASSSSTTTTSSSSSSLPSSPTCSSPSSPPATSSTSTSVTSSASTLLPYQQLQLQYQMHQLHVAQAASRSPPSAAASPLTASPYGSPLQAGSALLHDLLQQATSAGYPQTYYTAALMAAAASSTSSSTTTAYSATPKPASALPSLANVLGGVGGCAAVAIPTARHAYSQASSPSRSSAVADAVTSTAPKSMAIRNLLN